jgi:hypothetical protein
MFKQLYADYNGNIITLDKNKLVTLIKGELSSSINITEKDLIGILINIIKFGKENKYAGFRTLLDNTLNTLMSFVKEEYCSKGNHFLWHIDDENDFKTMQCEFCKENVNTPSNHIINREIACYKFLEKAGVYK